MRVSRLAVGGCAGLVLALLLAAPVSQALADLARARSALEALKAEVSAPHVASLPVEQSLKAMSSADAVSQLAARVRALAARGGVLVEGIEAGRGPGLARLNVRLSGSEAAVLGLADALERQRPLVRWRSWRVEPAGGGVRLTGDLVAPWG